jgi:hypothetical protein
LINRGCNEQEQEAKRKAQAEEGDESMKIGKHELNVTLIFDLLRFPKKKNGKRCWFFLIVINGKEYGL